MALMILYIYQALTLIYNSLFPIISVSLVYNDVRRNFNESTGFIFTCYCLSIVVAAVGVCLRRQEIPHLTVLDLVPHLTFLVLVYCWGNYYEYSNVASEKIPVVSELRFW